MNSSSTLIAVRRFRRASRQDVPRRQTVGARCLVAGVLLGAMALSNSSHAQWLTQSVTLKPGWNAVYLHVDASHILLDDLITGANPIGEIWLWRPDVSVAQFTTSPQDPNTSNNQWLSWDRSMVVADTLVRLVGNAAYLVRNTNTTDYTWSIQGKPVPPAYQWTVSGLNFVGFPTPSGSAPTFDNFLAPAPELQRIAEIYRYRGGELGSTNPVRVSSPLFRSTYVRRGEAFWIRAGTTYNRYFGPVQVSMQNDAGVHFGDKLGTYSIRLKNLTSTSRTVVLALGASETPPSGQQTNLVGTPPLLVRGALNSTNLTYAYTNLNAPRSFVLTADGTDGASLEVVLGLNRSAMPTAAGTLYAGILRITDSVGLMQVDAPVTATVADTSGLWVGTAAISEVGHYLKSYAVVTNAASVATNASVLRSNVMALNLPAPESETAGSTWTPHALNRNWQAMAVSTNGAKMVAAAYGGQVYTSTDYGTNWLARENNRAWTAMASSADGTKLVGAVLGGQLFTSTDSGVTWTGRASVTNWVAAATSADGAKLLAAARNGPLYTSTDSGATWTARETARAWSAVASSTNGANLVATVGSGPIFTSTNTGAAWTQRSTYLDLGTDGYGQLSAATYFSGGAFTVEAWVYIRSHRNWAKLVDIGNGSYSDNVVCSFSYFGFGQPMLQVYQWGNNVALISPNVLPLNTWTHMAFVFDGTNQGRIYVNGSLDTSGTMQAPRNVTRSAAYLGASSWGDANADACVADLRIWSVARSQAQIQQAAIRGIPLPAGTNGLVAQFSASPGSPTNDCSGHGLTLTPKGTAAFMGAPCENWSGVASSADGTTLTAVAYGGQVYRSTDAGLSWSAVFAVSNQNWTGIAGSANGNRWVAVADGGLLYTSSDSGVTWSARDSNRAWNGAALSGDGARWAALEYGGRVYTSADGASWAASSGSGTNFVWRGVGISADGTKQVASAYGGQIFVSTDGGATWTGRDTNRLWNGLAGSSDGAKWVASAASDGLYTSADGGTTWTKRSSGLTAGATWCAVASSVDGTRLAAVAPGYAIALSSDSGSTWTSSETARAWSGIASSADGANLAAVVNGGQVYVSTNSGATWSARESARNWSSIASSTNGARLAAVVNGGQIYTSMDYGTSWIARESNRVWTVICASGDGTKLVAGTDGGQFYTSTDSGVTWAARQSNDQWSAFAMTTEGTRVLASDLSGLFATLDRTFTHYDIDPDTGLIRVRTATGAPYVATATNTSLGAVSRTFPLRLIVHHNATNAEVNLLQRVFVGKGTGSNQVVATLESLLDPDALGSARRVSATHLPFSLDNRCWPKSSGALGLGSALMFNVSLAGNDHASSPFLHTFHPDHDNLTSDFKRVQAQGVESYQVERQITLTFTAPTSDFASLTASSQSLSGRYSEVVTFSGQSGQTRQFSLAGNFVLNRISPITILTRP